MKTSSYQTMTIRHFGNSAVLPTGTTRCPAARYASDPAATALRVSTQQHSGPEVWNDAG